MSSAVDRQRAADSFVGRDRELVRSLALLRSARLLTLTGPGGVGKTRLARELAGRAQAGDVLFIELDAVLADEHVPQAVATAMGVDARIGQQPLDALASAIGDDRVLMLLDNCEHLLDATAQLADSLLRRCRGLRILATSREALRVPGEVVLPVAQLSLPGPGQRLAAAAAMRCGAVALFVTRVSACDPDFELTGDNIALVIDICRRLDGLPLAIELAARRAGSCGLAEILAGLDGQLTTLSTGRGDHRAPPRHRELRAAIGWSYRLLTPTEQAVFRRVSALYGRFGLDQAAAVCDMDPAELRPILSDLAGKSLIVPLPGDPEQLWFRQLNTVRAYGCACLTASGELAATLDRGIAWLTGLAESVADAVCLTRDLQRRLAAEGDNLIAAVDYTADLGGDQHVLLALALARHWWVVEQTSAARALLTQVLPLAAGTALHACVLAEAAAITAVQGDHAEAMWLGEAAVRLARQAGPPVRLAKALIALEYAQVVRGDITAAMASAQQSAAILHQVGRPVDAAFVQHNTAWLVLAEGQAAEAAAMMAECLPVLREAASSHRGAALHTTGAVQLAQGDGAAAEAAFAEGLEAAPGETHNTAYQLEGLAIVAAGRGDARRALCLSAAATAIRVRLGVQVQVAWAQQVATAMMAAERKLGTVKAEAARASGRRLRGERLLGYALTLSGHPDGPPLTWRERQITALVARGMTNSDIAEGLQLSRKTVAAHLDSVRGKLGLRTRTQVAVWAATAYGGQGTRPAQADAPGWSQAGLRPCPVPGVAAQEVAARGPGALAAVCHSS